MKIALDLRYPPNTGVGRYAHELAAALGSSRRHEYRWLSRDDGDWRAVTTSAAPFSLREQLVLPGVLRRLRPDLFHATHFVIPLLWKGPLVVTIQDAIPLDYPETLSSPVGRLTYGPLLRAACRRAHYVLAPSAATAAVLGRHGLVPVSRVAVVPLAPPRWVSESDPPPSRIEGPYVLYVGQLKAHKNLVTLLRAYAAVAARSLPQLALRIVGEGPERARLGRIASRLGISKRLRIVANASDAELRGLYTQARVVVVPSVVEGFGLPALEAMACGTPVIISRAPALLETAGDAALTFDASAPDELARQLERVVTDEGLREDLRARGYAQVRRFSWERTAKLTEDVYDRVLAR